MDKDKLTAILDSHKQWLSYGTGERANLSGADLRGADLREADLRKANLSEANLSGADLRGANLRGADLSGADLRGANLRGANLRGANLRGANLSEADLSGADLSGANLRGANLPSPTMILLASWGYCSDTLTLELMRYDASCHPDTDSFSRWAAGGPCPYNGVRVQRAALFRERRECWEAGPSMRPYDLMIMVLKEHCKW